MLHLVVACQWRRETQRTHIVKERPTDRLFADTSVINRIVTSFKYSNLRNEGMSTTVAVKAHQILFRHAEYSESGRTHLPVILVASMFQNTLSQGSITAETMDAYGMHSPLFWQSLCMEYYSYFLRRNTRF